MRTVRIASVCCLSRFVTFFFSFREFDDLCCDFSTCLSQSADFPSIRWILQDLVRSIHLWKKRTNEWKFANKLSFVSTARNVVGQSETVNHNNFEKCWAYSDSVNDLITLHVERARPFISSMSSIRLSVVVFSLDSTTCSWASDNNCVSLSHLRAHKSRWVCEWYAVNSIQPTKLLFDDIRSEISLERANESNFRLKIDYCFISPLLPFLNANSLAKKYEKTESG